MKSNKQHVYLGRILNIPIELDYSWLFIFILITWFLANNYYPVEYKGWLITEYWIIGPVTAILFFMSVLPHELGHSLLAIRYKIQVQSITLFLFGVVAKITSEPPNGAANSQLSRQHFHTLLEGHAVAQAMSVNYGLIPGGLSLQQLADEHILDNGRRFFIVEELGQPAGLLTASNLNKVPRPQWTVTTADQVMTPVEQFHLLKTDSGLAEALEEMNLDGSNQLPVVADGRVRGVLTRESVMNFLRDLQERNPAGH